MRMQPNTRLKSSLLQVVPNKQKQTKNEGHIFLHRKHIKEIAQIQNAHTHIKAHKHKTSRLTLITADNIYTFSVSNKR